MLRFRSIGDSDAKVAEEQPVTWLSVFTNASRHENPKIVSRHPQQPHRQVLACFPRRLASSTALVITKMSSLSAMKHWQADAYMEASMMVSKAQLHHFHHPLPRVLHDLHTLPSLSSFESLGNLHPLPSCGWSEVLHDAILFPRTGESPCCLLTRGCPVLLSAPPSALQ